MKRRDFLHRAAALGLGVATTRARSVLAEPVPPAEVRGHVVCGNAPLPNVRVSDGFRVTRTNASGEFMLSVGPDSAPFLFVTIPAGYWTDQFFVPTVTALSESPVFRLERREVANQYTAIYLTDVHLGEGRAEQSYARFQATLDQLNALDPRPAVCWIGGDITLQGGKGQRYVELMSRLKMPVRNAVGNHEMLVRERDPRERFQQLFGPTYYSFDIGPVHYVTLDGCRVNREAEGNKSVEGELSRRELHWLEQDLRQVPDGTAKVVSIHIPLVSDYPERRGTTADRVPHWVVRNSEESVDLLARMGVSLVLQGHLHENQRIVQRGIEFVESISVCGRWWKTPDPDREHGVSGEPRGYRVLTVNGPSIQHRYQSSAEARTDAIGEIVGRPERLTAGEHAKLAINIFDAAFNAIVCARLDEGPLERLAPLRTQGYHENLSAAHHWEWTIPAAALTPGRHTLRVHVEAGKDTSAFEQPIVIA